MYFLICVKNKINYFDGSHGTEFTNIENFILPSCRIIQHTEDEVCIMSHINIKSFFGILYFHSVPKLSPSNVPHIFDTPTVSFQIPQSMQVYKIMANSEGDFTKISQYLKIETHDEFQSILIYFQRKYISTKIMQVQVR